MRIILCLLAVVAVWAETISVKEFSDEFIHVKVFEGTVFSKIQQELYIKKNIIISVDYQKKRDDLYVIRMITKGFINEEGKATGMIYRIITDKSEYAGKATKDIMKLIINQSNAKPKGE